MKSLVAKTFGDTAGIVAATLVGAGISSGGAIGFAATVMVVVLVAGCTLITTFTLVSFVTIAHRLPGGIATCTVDTEDGGVFAGR